MLDEVYGNGIPWPDGDWELTEQAVWFVPNGLTTLAGDTRAAVFVDERTEARPDVLPADQSEGFVDAEVTRGDVVVL